MTEVPEIAIEAVSAVAGRGETLRELASRAVGALPDVRDVGGVIAATFSNPERFPSLAVRIATELSLPADTPAFDLQMACSAYPYAVYLAGRLAADTGRRVLVVDGDVQCRLVDSSDHATGDIFSDAATASIVSAGGTARSRFAFMSRCDEALSCGETGPIRMDGFKVFTFVATEVAPFLRQFAGDYDFFVPHQANPYMVRQLAKGIGAQDSLVTIDDALKNPGSCSIPMALSSAGRTGRALIAGFGAGYSAAAGVVRIPETFFGKAL